LPLFAKTTKTNPLLIEEKIGFECLILLSPPTLATVCDESNDVEY
jgi:hypothetical protein